MKSLLVQLFGFPATLIHGDTLVLDRWLWLRKLLPEVPDGSKRLLDLGCGTGAFTIGAALRGYRSLGLSWDERNQEVAGNRARICRTDLADFEILDLRRLDQRDDLKESFDVAICCENIEHILDDEKLLLDISKCLSHGGILFLSTPNYNYRAITPGDNGPFSKVENGGHVRRGYTACDLERLCEIANLTVCQIGYCSGFLSQKITTGLMIIYNVLH